LPGVSEITDLRSLRKRLGSQTVVGKLLGISRETVGVYENGKAPPWYRLALEQLLTEKTRPDLGGPGLNSPDV